ncbi:unnamed protein product [Camellia sinensis]
MKALGDLIQLHSPDLICFQRWRDLWDYVCGIVTEPNPGHENYTKLSKDWKTSNAKILEMISETVINPLVLIQLRRFKSGKEAWDYLADLYGQSTFAKKYQLETEIRETKQGDRTIQEFHDVMVGLWDQLAKLENRDLSMRSSYKEHRDEQRLVQFLIALRDEFEPIRKSILCRSFLPSVETAVRELVEEEKRLKSSIVSKFSNLSIKSEDSFQRGKVKYDYSGGFDQSHKFNKPSSSRDMYAMSSSSVTETDDEPSFMGGLAKVAMASFAAVQVSRALYNYYTDEPAEPGVVESFSGTRTASRTLKILSYNVWFREDVEMDERMEALGDLIQLHSPDVICFQKFFTDSGEFEPEALVDSRVAHRQDNSEVKTGLEEAHRGWFNSGVDSLEEVTSNIYDIFQQSSWWKLYRCSVSTGMAHRRQYFCMQLSKLPVKSYSCKPFSNSIMGRELCVAEVEVEADVPLVVATSHLESPCPAPPKWDQMFSKERVAQAQEALNFLKKNANVIFCGDMNWDDELDGQFPLLNGWVDAWVQLRPGENGWTYDTKSNQMISGNRPLQKRLDRFVCKLRDFKIRRIDMIGMEAIPGVSYWKEKKVKNRVQQLKLPVLPSDHYGLLLTICTQ